MKKLLANTLLLILTLNFAMAQDMENQWQNRGQGMRYGKSEEFKNLTPDERHAKMQEIYDSASPEQKAKMDEKRKVMQDKATELGFDLNTTEGRQKFHDYRQQNKGQGKGMGMGKGKGKGKGQGRGRHAAN